MILVDSSVWIDYFRDTDTREVARLDGLLGKEVLAIGDLILTEVLQGFPSDHEFEQAQLMFSAFNIVVVGGEAVALQAARNFRRLRALGITVRKTIDTLIATRCIMDGHRLLYSDRDFDPFVEHLGLTNALT
jgi:predicted nucleic acid-binding protein